jgi:hypothetical protein
VVATVVVVVQRMLFVVESEQVMVDGREDLGSLIT